MVVITGVGLLSSLGESAAEFHSALLAQQTAIGTVELDFGTRLAGLLHNSPEAKYLAGKNTRPLDRISRLVCAAASLALEDSGWSVGMRTEHEVGLVLGTMFCGMHTIAEFDRRALLEGPASASPMDFANTVISAAAGQTAIWHGLRGINSTVAAGAASGLEALCCGADLIRNGQAQALLAGGADEVSYESLCGFDRTGLLCDSRAPETPRPVPFEARRSGFALGEAAALVMLEHEEFARRRGARILGRITGTGSAFDASRGRQERSAAGAVARAILQALQEAGKAPEEVDCASASADGSVALDRHEALGLAAALNGRVRSLPVAALKSMTGETLGAGGALQVASMLEVFRGRELPGIRGLERLDRDLPLPLATCGNRPVDARTALISSISLSGSTCALILEQSR